MSPQERLDIYSASVGDGFEMGYRLPAADDGVVLAMVFHIVEQIGEVAGSIGSGDIRHDIRLSDIKSNVKPRASNRKDVQVIVHDLNADGFHLPPRILDLSGAVPAKTCLQIVPCQLSRTRASMTSSVSGEKVVSTVPLPMRRRRTEAGQSAAGRHRFDRSLSGQRGVLLQVGGAD